MADSIICGNQNTTKLINQLKASSTQYPVLNKKQEREMIEQNRNNRDRLNFLLFMHNIRTVFNQAKAYVSKTNDFDALVQNGMMGLGEAARRFDIDRDIKFCTYATIWVKKYMSMPYYTAQFKLDMKTVSMNSPTLAASADENLSAEDTFENYIQSYLEPSVDFGNRPIESELSANEQSEICEKLYSRLEADSSLSAVDKAVFTDLFIEREKTRDVAEKYNLDQTAISEIKHRILRKFKDILKREYDITSYSDLA